MFEFPFEGYLGSGGSELWAGGAQSDGRGCEV